MQDFWSGTLGLPRNLSELGIDNADIDQLVNNLHHTKGEIFGGYVKLNRELTRDIYKACEDKTTNPRGVLKRKIRTHLKNISKY